MERQRYVTAQQMQQQQGSAGSQDRAAGSFAVSSGSTWCVVGLAVVSKHNRPLLTQTFLPQSSSPSSRPQSVSLPGDPFVAAAGGAAGSDIFGCDVYGANSNELHLQFLMYSSLDVCDERIAQRRILHEKQLAAAGGSSPASTQGGSSTASSAAATAQALAAAAAGNGRFLQVLLHSHNWRSWGLHSNTGIKVILVTEGDGDGATATKVSMLLDQIYNRVVYAICNPFRDLDADLSSPAFLKELRSLLAPCCATGAVIRM